jgi:hypothetical protein
MGQNGMVWPAARLVEEVSVFARWTSEGAAPKDRPPLFSGAGSSRGEGSRAEERPSDAPGAARGRYSPSLKMAFQIARVFGVPLDEVFHCPENEDGRST